MMVETMDAEAVRTMLAPIWAKNRDHILERLGHVRHALVSDSEPTNEQRADLHALVGTLGTYGWPEGSELVERIRLHLAKRSEGTGAIDADARSRLVGQLDALTAILAAS